MSLLRRALGNTAIMLVAQLITWSATLVTTAVLGARLGVDAFGTLYLAMSFGLLFSVLVEFGLNQQLVRAVARDPTWRAPTWSTRSRSSSLYRWLLTWRSSPSYICSAIAPRQGR